MEPRLDADVKAVAEFMQSNVKASRLAGVASAVAELAPALWGHLKSEEVRALTLEAVKPKQAAANG